MFSVDDGGMQLVSGLISLSKTKYYELKHALDMVREV